MSDYRFSARTLWMRACHRGRFAAHCVEEFSEMHRGITGREPVSVAVSRWFLFIGDAVGDVTTWSLGPVAIASRLRRGRVRL